MGTPAQQPQYHLGELVRDLPPGLQPGTSTPTSALSLVARKMPEQATPWDPVPGTQQVADPVGGRVSKGLVLLQIHMLNKLSQSNL